ncbi:hypothetical protein [Hydrogenimonas sp.]
MTFADQMIYRFSKAQDTIGAKLFKAFLLYEGERVDRPFRDILDRFEEMGILDVNEWFALREVRNQISHDYEMDPSHICELLELVSEAEATMRRIVATMRALVR